jgi:hypothetical protein
MRMKPPSGPGHTGSICVEQANCPGRIDDQLFQDSSLGLSFSQIFTPLSLLGFPPSGRDDVQANYPSS